MGREHTEERYKALPLTHRLGGKQGLAMKFHFTDGEIQGEGSDKVSGKNPGPVTPRSTHFPPHT